MARQKAVFTFTVPLEYCHSGDVVQGGFVTAMLDAAMSHALLVPLRTSPGRISGYLYQFIGICRGEQLLRVSGWVKKRRFARDFSKRLFMTPREN
ncbi:MAG: hypothetical protein CM15mP74_08970 [Halieaceae bacterium]|nr:MAG: hypothetical protein CM15mP74_08970 [Halieaceae bacterium]